MGLEVYDALVVSAVGRWEGGWGWGGGGSVVGL